MCYSGLTEFIEMILSCETSWNVVYGGDADEDNKYIICEASDKYSLMLTNLIGKTSFRFWLFNFFSFTLERSTFVPNVKYQVKIIELIFEIMDDFRLRLSQLIHADEEKWPYSHKFFSILNTFDYFVALIHSWQSDSVSSKPI